MLAWKRVWLWFFGLGVLIAACGPMTPFPTQPAEPTAMAHPSPMPTTMRTPMPTPTPQGTPPDDVVQALETIEAQVRTLRGAQQAPNLSRVILSPRDLQAKAEALQREEAIVRPNAWAWQAMDLIPRGYDLETALSALPEAPWAVYAPQQQTIYFTAPQGVTGPLRLAYAYAYTRALQAQTYAPPSCDDHLDRCLAVQALTTGDALYTEYLWFFTYATQQDRNDVAAFYASGKPAEPVPLAVAKQQRFAYDYGYAFIQHLFQKNGWGSIARAFATPPVSTEQILAPDAYPEDKPQAVTLPQGAPLGKAWEEVARGEMGAWLLYLMLTASQHPEARLPTGETLDLLQGWGGGAWVVFRQTDTQDLALAVDVHWDSNDATVAFVKAFVKYARGRFGPLTDRNRGYRTLMWKSDAGAAVLYYNTGERRTIWAFAPTRALAQALVQWLMPASP